MNWLAIASAVIIAGFLESAYVIAVGGKPVYRGVAFAAIGVTAVAWATENKRTSLFSS